MFMTLYVTFRRSGSLLIHFEMGKYILNMEAFIFDIMLFLLNNIMRNLTFIGA